MPFQRFRISVALLACALLVACAGSTRRDTAAQVPTTDAPVFTVERHREDRKIAEGVDTIVIDNPYGEIQVRQTRSGAIGMTGTEQRIGERPRVARLEWFQDGTRQGLRVRYDEHDPSGPPANPRLGRVDLGLFVPPGFKLDLRTDFATINVRRLRNPVHVRTRTGAVIAATRGAMDIHSDSGEIRAWTMSADWEAPTVLRSGGNILADVPLFRELDLQVSAGKQLRADFELDAESVAGEGVTSARLWRGEGSHRMRIESGADVVLTGLAEPIP